MDKNGNLVMDSQEGMDVTYLFAVMKSLKKMHRTQSSMAVWIFQHLAMMRSESQLKTNKATGLATKLFKDRSDKS